MGDEPTTLARILAGLDGDPRRSLRNPLEEIDREQRNPWAPVLDNVMARSRGFMEAPRWRAPNPLGGDEAAAAQIGDDARQGDWLPALGGLAAILFGAGAPRGARKLTLSENLQQVFRPERLTTPEGHPQFYYHLLDDGRKIGSATGHVVGDTAHLGWLGSTALTNELGLSGVRQLREAFARDFPQVRTFVGDRSSGARAPDIGSKMQADRAQSVTFPKMSD